jgi:glycosyltransferase involved in cell wall biosynthesis
MISEFPTASRLPTPVRITEQVWPEGTVPVVSIHCITYQHGKFIREAIEGFLMQETTFPVEILIHDDASTDGTADIIREYEVKHPQLIKPIYQKENQWSKGNKPGNIILERVKGRFIAFCEGDDYWTAKDKLEFQVDLLNTHPAVAISCHAAQIVGDTARVLATRWPAWLSADCVDSAEVMIEAAQTVTVMMRSEYVHRLDRKKLNKYFIGDYPLFYSACQISEGLIHFANRCMAIYRKHDGNMTSGWGNSARFHWKMGLLWEDLAPPHKRKSHPRMRKRIWDFYHTASRKFTEEGNQLLALRAHFRSTPYIPCNGLLGMRNYFKNLARICLFKAKRNHGN